MRCQLPYLINFESPLICRWHVALPTTHPPTNLSLSHPHVLSWPPTPHFVCLPLAAYPTFHLPPHFVLAAYPMFRPGHLPYVSSWLPTSCLLLVAHPSLIQSNLLSSHSTSHPNTLTHHPIRLLFHPCPPILFLSFCSSGHKRALSLHSRLLVLILLLWKAKNWWVVATLFSHLHGLFDFALVCMINNSTYFAITYNYYFLVNNPIHIFIIQSSATQSQKIIEF